MVSVIAGSWEEEPGPGSRRPPPVIQCGLSQPPEKQTLGAAECGVEPTVRQKTRRVWEGLSFSFCAIYIKCENFQNFIVEFYLQNDFCK